MEARAHLLWMQAAPPRPVTPSRPRSRPRPDHERLLEDGGRAGQDDRPPRRGPRPPPPRRRAQPVLRRLPPPPAPPRRGGDWAEAARSARAALGLDISLVEARIVLVESLVRTRRPRHRKGRTPKARAFDPGAVDALRRSLFPDEPSPLHPHVGLEDPIDFRIESALWSHPGRSGCVPSRSGFPVPDTPEENAWPVVDEVKDVAKWGARAPHAQPYPPPQEVTSPVGPSPPVIREGEAPRAGPPQLAAPAEFSRPPTPGAD